MKILRNLCALSTNLQRISILRSSATFSRTRHSSSHKTALMCPGQGSQYIGMGKDLALEFNAAKRVFDEVDSALNFPLSQLMFEGPSDQINLTEQTQPAILAHSLAVLRTLETEIGFKVEKHFQYVLGHSLGEYSALVAAQSTSLQEAARIVRVRGKAMQEVNPKKIIGVMVALLGEVSLQIAEEIASKAQNQTNSICEVANINSQSQIVLSGSPEAIDEVIRITKQYKRIKTKKVEVSAPFHCSLMKSASKIMEEEFKSMQLKKPIVPLISNVNAQPVEDPQEIKSLLVEQVVKPVRWLQSIQYCLENGITQFVELGPGKILSSLIRQIDPNVPCISLGTADEIKKIIKDKLFQDL